MAELFASGHIVDCILALMLVELALLVFVRKRGRIHLELAPLAINCAAGAALLLALRAALRREGWSSIAIWLVVAFIAHGSDLWMRSLRSRVV